MIDVFTTLKVPGPIPTAISEPFWAAVRRGEFVLQRCEDCGRRVFYPRAHCPHCWGSRLVWHAASGRGAVKSFSAIHRPGHFAWAEAAPYVVALIELDEGPTMLSQLLLANPGDAAVGMRVTMRPVEIGEFVLPFFAPDAVKAHADET
ncbi:Zn-ribbon domain-containing OB-fold protein [Paraburkholderia acidipaludis]|uniref:Zn-ribbon domain-containing OB-fold protein n=1 Tax=Paraburkholderia acidipaludis TaxID=660537 RepID=UPI0004881434|nr:Zn-ribbon domain-containing OB-fold protein [Paraburkholderia acidipaludis]